MTDIVLATFAGRDVPGLTAKMMAICAKRHCDILDIGQSVIHDRLSIGLLLTVSSAADAEGLQSELQAMCDEESLHLDWELVSSERYSSWVNAQGSPRYILTLLARRVSAEHIAALGSVVYRHGLNIDGITRLSGRLPLGPMPPASKACVEFSVRGEATDRVAFKRELMSVASGLDMDLAFQQDDMYRRNRRLVVFDMDSTLIEAEVIDELAKRAGVGEKVAEITERAMRGELDFQASFRERLGLLKGLSEGVLGEIADRLPITEGAAHLLQVLKKLGYRTAIVSGGFTYFAKVLQSKLGIDYVFANELAIRDGRVTGEVEGVIVDGERKAQLLRELAQQENISLQQVIAVGDGANDLPMLGIAGLGIAFRAKPLVKEAAEQSISTLGLDAILYLLGISDRYQSAD
ncbi:MAG: phosphoserine phosphatase SerB [Pseudomonadota bacterium]